MGHYDGVTHHLTLSTADLEAREAHARFKGGADIFLDAAGSLERVHGEISAANIALNMPGVFAGPVGYQAVSLAGDVSGPAAGRSISPS